MAGEASRWLSYDDVADALGLSPEAAKRLSLRRGWPRCAGADGGTEIAVPGWRPPVPSSEPGDAEDDLRRRETRSLLDHLGAQVDRLTEELAETRTEMRGVRYEAESLRVDAARAQVFAALIEAERARCAEIRTERDRLAHELARGRRPWVVRAVDALLRTRYCSESFG